MNHPSNRNHNTDHYDASNSALGVCTASKSGRRKSGVEDAVAWITAYPGIDGYTVAWLHAGGKLVVDNAQYHFSGLPFSADFNSTTEHYNARFAQVLKMQVRIQEAAKRGLIEETPRLIDRRVNAVDSKGVGFIRDIKTTGYKLVGHADPVLSDQHQAGTAPVNEVADDTIDTIEAQGIPDNFDDFMAQVMPDLSD